jgi:exosortase
MGLARSLNGEEEDGGKAGASREIRPAEGAVPGPGLLPDAGAAGDAAGCAVELASGGIQRLNRSLPMGLFAKLDREARWALLVLGGVLVFLIWDQQHWWRLRDEYLFGFLVPAFVGWVLYERLGLFRLSLDRAGFRPRYDAEKRWARELAAARKGSPRTSLERLTNAVALGGATVGFLGVFFAALYRAMEGNNLVTTQLLAMGNALLVLSAGYLFLDRRTDGEPIPYRERLMMVGLLLFPALIWLLSAPLFNFLDRTIKVMLQERVSFVVFHLFDLLGYSIIREESVLVLPTGQVGVEEACSGIYSLMASLFAGSFLAATCFPPGFATLWKKVGMVAAAMGFAFLTNIGRSLILTFVAYRDGPEAIEEPFFILGVDMGSLHDFLGYAVIVPVVIALRLLVPLFNFSFEIEEGEARHVQRPAAVASATGESDG